MFLHFCQTNELEDLQKINNYDLPQKSQDPSPYLPQLCSDAHDEPHHMRVGQEWEERDDGTSLRTIKKVSGLFDVSLVTVGAYEDASVAIRSLDERKEVAKEAEEPANPCIAYKRAQATAKASLVRAEQLRKKSK